MGDLVMLWILEALLLVTALLRILLEKKKGQPLSLGWKVQIFLFPAALLVGIVLFQTGRGDYIIPLVLLGVLEELVCRGLLARSRKRDDDMSSDDR